MDSPMTLYEVTVRFLAEDEVYGQEVYYVRAQTGPQAAEHALKLSEGSLYFDDRIDFRREDEAEEFSVDDLLDGDFVHDAPSTTRVLGM